MPTIIGTADETHMRHAAAIVGTGAPSWFYAAALRQRGFTVTPFMTGAALARLFGDNLEHAVATRAADDIVDARSAAGWLEDWENTRRALAHLADRNYYARRVLTESLLNRTWLPNVGNASSLTSETWCLLRDQMMYAAGVMAAEAYLQTHIGDDYEESDLPRAWDGDQAVRVAVFLAVFCHHMRGRWEWWSEAEEIYESLRRDRERRILSEFRRWINDYEHCAGCSELLPRDRMESFGGDCICESCSDDGFIFCDNCGDAVHVDDTGTTPSSEQYCRSCVSEHLRECANCGDFTWSEDDECVSCGYCNSDCDGTFGDLEVYSYSYKPTAEFFQLHADPSRVIGNFEGMAVLGSSRHTDEPFFGVELELNCLGNQYDAVNGGNAIVSSDIYRAGFLYAKSDCTVSGPEIVSHPATLAAHAVLWDSFPFQELAEQHSWSGWKGANAGIHIHISRKAFKNAAHLARFQYYFGEWGEELVKFAGRNCGSYGYHGPSMRGVSNAIRYAKAEQWPARGSAINYYNHRTIEVRIFRSSLRRETLAAYLEFLHGLVNYSRVMTANAMIHGKSSEFGTFYEWLKNGERAETYSNAIARFDQRVYGNTETENN